MKQLPSLLALLSLPLCASAEKLVVIAVGEGQISQQAYTLLPGKCTFAKSQYGDHKTVWARVENGYKCTDKRGCYANYHWAYEYQLQLRDGRSFKARLPKAGDANRMFVGPIDARFNDVVLDEACGSAHYSAAEFRAKEKEQRQEFDLVNSGRIHHGYNRRCSKSIASFLVDEDNGEVRNAWVHEHEFDCNNP